MSLKLSRSTAILACEAIVEARDRALSFWQTAPSSDAQKIGSLLVNEASDALTEIGAQLGGKYAAKKWEPIPTYNPRRR